MRIKTTKQMRLDELIKYIFDGGIEDKVFPSNGGSSFDMCEARVSGSGNIKTSGYINEHTTFTVEVEEELTEETKLHDLTAAYYDKSLDSIETELYGIESIEDILGEDNIEQHCLAIFHKQTLIWSRDTGIPAGGVIECF